MIRIALLIVITLFYSCAIGPTHGILFTNTKFPGEYNPANDVRGSSSADGCMHSILSIISWGDASAGSIAHKNKIIRLATIDHSTMSILGFVYARYCTIITGEGESK